MSGVQAPSQHQHERERHMPTDDRYRTHDLYIASYLNASGVKILRVEHTDTRRKVLVFDLSLSEGLAEMQEYMNGVEISAIDYANAIKAIKGMIANM
jgi:hypothetical protein